MKELEYCLATAGDIDEMRSTLFEHGPNDWNYLPKQGVVQELKDVADGKAIGVLAKSEEVMLGFAVAYPRYIHFPKYIWCADQKKGEGNQSTALKNKQQSYIPFHLHHIFRSTKPSLVFFCVVTQKR